MFQELSDLINKGIDSVFSDYPIIVWQLLALVLLVIFVAAFLWRPITKFIEREEQEATKELAQAHELNAKAKEYEALKHSEYKEIKDKLEILEKDLIKEANLKKERIINDAIKEMDRQRVDLKVELANDIIKQEEDIKKAIKEIALIASQKIIKNNLDTKNISNTLVDDIIEELSDAKFK